jgi:hypothetical protein
MRRDLLEMISPDGNNIDLIRRVPSKGGARKKLFSKNLEADIAPTNLTLIKRRVE